MTAARIERVRAELEKRPPGLIRHVRRVLSEAFALGAAWDLDPRRIELAVWGHDLFRAYEGPELLRLARKWGIAVTEADSESPVLLHGPIAAKVMAADFRVDDEHVLAAVRNHTLGLGEMSLLAKVILLADKVEAVKRRGQVELQAIRRVARRDLDLALLCWADRKLLLERCDGWPSDSRHWQTRTAWVDAHHALFRNMAVVQALPTE